jgi:glyoxylase-like metal-dependent hydrolase (beta-lactamase superfamily II)
MAEGGTMITLAWKLFRSGWCRHLERVTLRGGRWKVVDYPALWVLLKHPREGWMLVDSGYAPRVLEACRRWPFWIYEKITPMHIPAGESAVEILAKARIAAAEIRHLFITHFHADHLGGLRDFPAATFWCSRAAWSSIQGLSSWAALRQAFIPSLLPDDFTDRLRFYPEATSQISSTNSLRGADVFGDASLWVIELPGHARGQVGFHFQDTNSQSILLAADAAWHRETITEGRMPLPLAALVSDDWTAFRRTIQKLSAHQQAHPETVLIPFHCQTTAEKWLTLPAADRVSSKVPDPFSKA